MGEDATMGFCRMATGNRHTNKQKGTNKNYKMQGNLVLTLLEIL